MFAFSTHRVRVRAAAYCSAALLLASLTIADAGATSSSEAPGHATSTPVSSGFATASFDTTMGALPAHYRGHDIEKAFRSEFDTTAQAGDATAETPAPAGFVFAFWVDPQLVQSRIDAASGRLTLELQRRAMEQGLVSPLTTWTVNDDRSALWVSNRPGLGSAILAVPGGGMPSRARMSADRDFYIVPLDGHSQGEAARRPYDMVLSLPAAGAHRLAGRLRVLAICEVGRPAGGQPTANRSEPAQMPARLDPHVPLRWGHYLYVNLHALWVCDPASGEVFLRRPCD